MIKTEWIVRKGNGYIFSIYYRTINQKDKLLYIDMEKNVFQFIYQNRKLKQL